MFSIAKQKHILITFSQRSKSRRLACARLRA